MATHLKKGSGMTEATGTHRLTSLPVWGVIVTVAALGACLLGFAVSTVTWDFHLAMETFLLTGVIVLAGFFPIPVGPRIKAGVTTAPLLATVLLLPLGAAVLAAAVGTLAYSLALRLRPEADLHLPWFKYPFNIGEATLTSIAGAAVWSAVQAESLFVPGAIGVAAAMYLVNTGLVSVVVGVQIRMNPALIWIMGTRENGLAEVSLFAFGYLGAVAYDQNPLTLLVLAAPVWILHVAFGRLATMNSILADRNGQLVAAIDGLKEAQGELVGNAKLASVGAFSLDLAHQLRNPLFVVIGRLESMQDAMKRGEMPVRHVDAAVASAWRMQELVETFMDMGRREGSNLDPIELVEDALGMTMLRYTKQVVFHRQYGDDLPHLSGNPVLLREALSNLLANAADASPEGGEITIQVAEHAGFLEIDVVDHGAGIPSDLMEGLFEPFHTRKAGGLGLGLFSARHIVRLHDGEVTVASRVGVGTRMSIRLPAVAGVAGSVTEPVEPAPQEARTGNQGFEDSRSADPRLSRSRPSSEAMRHTT